MSLEDLWGDFGASEKKSEIGKETKLVHPIESSFFPISLVKDFERFVDYIRSHKVELTKTNEYISRKHLIAINDQLSVKNQDATPYMDQEYYPYIHFLYYIALGGRILEKVPGKAGKLQLKESERAEQFKELLDIEKYFFLLETFWVDVNWARILNERTNTRFFSLQKVLYVLSKKKSGYSLLLYDDEKMTRVNQDYQLDSWSYFLLYFEWLGLWVCEINQERIASYWLKNQYFAKSIQLTEFGAKVIPVLLLNRNFGLWNIPHRRESGEINPIPGAELEDMMFGEIPQKMVDAIFEMMEEDQSSESFFQPFTGLFPNESIQRTLPRKKWMFVDGHYTFKVSLTSGIWRKVVLSGQHTMNHLHKVIIDSFNFDNDHLYSFFMDGIKWSNDCIACEYDNFGHPNASKIRIGDIGLESGQRFLYLFDYGDEWTFTVEMEHIRELESVPFQPYLKIGKGKAPVQYREDDFEDE